MRKPSILPVDQTLFDIELLRAMRGRLLSLELRVLCVIGAHRFEELALVNRLFPSLQHIYLFEPQTGPLAALHSMASQDPRIRVFPVAVSDADGVAMFNVASNDGESSSLLQLGTHRELFPYVTMQSTIEVQTRRLESVLSEHRLAPPDAMIIDVQGAEYLVLKSFSASLLDRVRLIYTEVSTEAVYESAGLLSEVEALLEPRFVNLGFAALREEVPMHGNAVFVAAADIEDALAQTTHEYLRRAFHRLRRSLCGRHNEQRGITA